jgi:hypothetical protein
MASPDTNWAERRKKGFGRYLLVDGFFFTGGPFAVLMQIFGYFFLADANQTFSDYFVSARTWLTFFAHAGLFGGIMGSIKWWRNERAFASENKTTN